MRPLRLLLHALLLPKIYIAFLLIKNAPNAARPDVGLAEKDYHLALLALVLAALILFYGSYVSGGLKRQKHIPLQKRKGLIWAFIITLVAIDVFLVYYIHSIKTVDAAYLT